MTTQTETKHELLTTIGGVIEQLQSLLSALPEQAINRVPYLDSWTAGQLVCHVAKSIQGMALAMGQPAKPAGRDWGEKIGDLQKTFLDFDTKMKSPTEIVPEEGPYEKRAIRQELTASLDALTENTHTASLTDLVSSTPLGEVTKLEILHFVWYHTQRHVYQMQKIDTALANP